MEYVEVGDIELTQDIDEHGNIEWKNKAGELHRTNGPAIEWADGGKFWYCNGELHRDGDLPAVEFANGKVEYWRHGIEGFPSDGVSSPTHYEVEGKQLWDVMPDLSTKEEFLGYCKLNIVKYVSRYGKKNGIEDLKKAGKYIERMVRFLEEEKK